MIYLLTGQPGTGKSTVAVDRAIMEYAAAGRRVVANFPIDFAPICNRSGTNLSRAVVEVIPDRPTRADLDLTGFGGVSEEKAGLLIVDEAGIWLNARTWAGKDRELIIDWLTQSRKRYWDIILISQSVHMLDKMVREAVCEGIARIRRLDRVKFLGVRLPRLHIGTVRYGIEANAPVLERWFYRGAMAHKCFGSYRLFGAESTHYSVLPAELSKLRYIKRRSLLAIPELTATILKVALWPFWALIGSLLDRKGRGYLVGWSVAVPAKRRRVSAPSVDLREVGRHARAWYACQFPEAGLSL